jgi:hypothetical protein
LPAADCLQAETQLVLTMDEQQVPVTVRPAEARMVGAAATTTTTSAAATTPPGGGGQALEVQLPHRIMYVRDCGTGNAQLLRAEVDGQAAVLQVLEAGPRQYALQHCGAQRVVQVDGVLAAQLARHMPVPQVEDFSKVGGCMVWWVGGVIERMCDAEPVGWECLGGVGVVVRPAM